jgi:hypothetical protein
MRVGLIWWGRCCQSSINRFTILVPHTAMRSRAPDGAFHTPPPSAPCMSLRTSYDEDSVNSDCIFFNAGARPADLLSLRNHTMWPHTNRHIRRLPCVPCGKSVFQPFFPCIQDIPRHCRRRLQNEASRIHDHSDYIYTHKLALSLLLLLYCDTISRCFRHR